MFYTLLFAILLMAGLLLMLWAGVGFVQDKKYFTSAPPEVVEKIPDHTPERFKGQRAIGWILMIFSLVLMVGALVLAGADGIKNGYGFWAFFARYLLMFILLKAFDIGFFDWFLLCNNGLNFFPRYYPQVKSVLGHHLFGFNKKDHMLQILAAFPVSAVLAWICILF